MGFKDCIEEIGGNVSHISFVLPMIPQRQISPRESRMLLDLHREFNLIQDSLFKISADCTDLEATEIAERSKELYNMSVRLLDQTSKEAII